MEGRPEDALTYYTIYYMIYMINTMYDIPYNTILQSYFNILGSPDSRPAANGLPT